MTYKLQENYRMFGKWIDIIGTRTSYVWVAYIGDRWDHLLCAHAPQNTHQSPCFFNNPI